MLYINSTNTKATQTMSAHDLELQHQEAVSDLAEKLLDAEIAKGAAFTEGLSNWAMNEALRQIPSPA